MIKDISELDDLGNRMRVMWRKANNFYTSFAGDLLNVREALQSGEYGDDWNITKWLALKAGLFESTVIAVLKAHQNALADEEREKLVVAERERKQAIQAEKEAEKRDRAEKRAVRAAERASAAAAVQARKDERAAKIAADKAEAKRLAANEANRKSRQKKREKEQQAKREEAERKDAERAAAAQAVIDRNDSPSPRLEVLLSECRVVFRTSRIELGRRFVEMKYLVETFRAGINLDTGKPWTWEEWRADKLQEWSRATVYRYISEFVSERDKNGYNVVPFMSA